MTHFVGRPARGARTPLFRSLVRAMRLAHAAGRQSQDHPGAPIDALRSRVSRRSILSAGASGALALGGMLLLGACASPQRAAGANPSGPRIAIVGGGIAGLTAGYYLKRRAGLDCEIFEASRRTGGRMFTARDLLAPDLTTELGGEFIDSAHEDVLALAAEFGFELIDTANASETDLAVEAYFFEGHHYSAAQLAEAFIPLVERLAADINSIDDRIDFEHDGGAKELDRLSLAQYLDRIGATGWLRALLEVAYVTEFGLDAGDQSALNFLTMIPTEEPDGPLALLGDSDERYKILGGNQRIVDELAHRLDGQIRLDHRLTRIRSRGNGYLLSFDVPNGRPREIRADYVIMTIPFTLLRDVELGIDLPAAKLRAIDELGYGQCAKVMAGFDTRPWRDLGFAGNIFTDEPFQLAWDNSRQQGGASGGITFYSGGTPALRAVEGTVEAQAHRFLRSLEKAYPGSWARHNGTTARFDWPHFPWSKGAYACYRPGQWTSISGAEKRPVGHLLFAGEHCSKDFQGFMNGGAETGREAAESLIAMLIGESRAA